MNRACSTASMHSTPTRSLAPAHISARPAKPSAWQVDGSRLVFHSKFPKHSELLVKAHADLFLDTPLFNAHTTGGDVLWAGIPLVTLPQENFAQRVAVCCQPVFFSFFSFFLVSLHGC